MKNHTMTAGQIWKLTRTAIGGLLVMIAGGCCCYTIQPQPCCGTQTGQPQPAPQDRRVSAGPFVPTQEKVLPGGVISVCTPPKTVSGKYVRFLVPPTQTPEPGNIGFRGSLYNITTDSPIPNSDYYLQLFVNSQIKFCCTNVNGSLTDIGYNVTAGYPYRFTVHFKSGAAPASNNQIILNGTWTNE